MINPLVTVYIANYNYGKYISESIKSVLAQSYKNFELLIVDDGSTDDSKKIINTFKDNRIKKFFQKNIGLNKTNNFILHKAKGKFIIRLDADDFFAKNAIKELVNKFKKSRNVAMIFPDYYLVDEKSNIIGRVKRHNFNSKVKLFDQPAHGACTMIRKDSLIKVGGYDEEFRCQDGYDIWLKIIKSFKVININQPLFFYRQHDKSLTSNELEILKTRSEIKKKFVINNRLPVKKTFAIIPIRTTIFNNKLFPLLKVGGKNLIDWTLEIALNEKSIDKVIVATNNSELKKYILDAYGSKINIFERSEESTRINASSEVVVSEILSELKRNKNLPDYAMIMYIDNPFRNKMYISKAINTMRIFNVNAVESVRRDDSLIYQHDGAGLKLIQKNKLQRLERDQIYKRSGGLHLIKVDNFIKNKDFFYGEIGHIIVDEYASFSIRTKLDLKISKIISKLFANE